MSEPSRDEAKFTRPSFLPGVELVAVAYRDRSFPEHSHAEWVLGAILAGAEKLIVDGTADMVETGQVLRLHPDQPHANRTRPIAEVALDVGYVDQSHFTRQFQRIVGGSPKRYLDG